MHVLESSAGLIGGRNVYYQKFIECLRTKGHKYKSAWKCNIEWGKAAPENKSLNEL